MKRRILSVLCCLILLSILSVTVFAIEVPDLNRKGSISITMTYKGEAVPGGSLTLYRVAEVHVENGADYSFRFTQDYADCQISLENLSSAETAQALAEYTERNKITGSKLRINDEGQITFNNLELGLYLLVQQDAAAGYEPASPFLVSVPTNKNNSYIYNVDGSPKLSLERAPTEPPSPTTPPSSNLPQTGLNQWPIPVMAVSGLLLFALGLVLYTIGKKRTHES